MKVHEELARANRMNVFRNVALAAAALVAAIASPAHAQPQFPERGTASVLDLADIIEPAAEAELSAKLDAFEERNQRQFVVATIPSLDGYDIADYGYQLGRHWGLGDAEEDDGIILLVAPSERKLRIEVGYGLEHIIPDGLAYDIINRDITPRFRDGDMTGGIMAGADAIIRQLELPPEEAAAIAAQASQPHESGFPVGVAIWMAIMVIFFVILPMIGAMTGHKRYRRHGVAGTAGEVLLWTAVNAAMSGGRGSGGSGSSWGGGGFSGGGGSFGGGGASGSW